MGIVRFGVLAESRSSVLYNVVVRFSRLPITSSGAGYSIYFTIITGSCPPVHPALGREDLGPGFFGPPESTTTQTTSAEPIQMPFLAVLYSSRL